MEKYGKFKFVVISGCMLRLTVTNPCGLVVNIRLVPRVECFPQIIFRNTGEIRLAGAALTISCSEFY